MMVSRQTSTTAADGGVGGPSGECNLARATRAHRAQWALRRLARVGRGRVERGALTLAGVIWPARVAVTRDGRLLAGLLMGGDEQVDAQVDGGRVPTHAAPPRRRMAAPAMTRAGKEGRDGRHNQWS